ncbi:MAG: hypothetical protein ACON4I_06455 [Candidatus Puniceispirillaceae bacterium]
MSEIDFSKTYLTNGLSTHENYRARPASRRPLVWLALLAAAAATAVAVTN